MSGLRPEAKSQVLLGSRSTTTRSLQPSAPERHKVGLEDKREMGRRERMARDRRRGGIKKMKTKGVGTW